MEIKLVEYQIKISNISLLKKEKILIFIILFLRVSSMDIHVVKLLSTESYYDLSIEASACQVHEAICAYINTNP